MDERELSEIFEAIERELIANLKRNMLRHKSWEKAFGFEWPAWQAEKLKEMARFRRENKAIMEKYSSLISAETQKMLLEQYAEGEKKAREEMLSNSGLFTEISDDSFFGIFDEKIESLIEEVQGKETMAEKSALRMMDDVYRQTIIKADFAVQTGSMTVQQAVELAVKDFARQGINSIEYKDGRRVNIADYVYMALQTSNTRAGLYGGAKQRAALGIDTVSVSQYHACSPTCQPWQGKNYIDDVYGVFDGEVYGNKGKSRNGKWYLLLSVAVEAGLFHPHCRHTLVSYREGYRDFLPVDGEETRRRYKLEQQQRAYERKIRKWKRMLEASDDPVWQATYKRKVREAQKDLREFIKSNSDVLRRDPWREKIYKDTVEKSVKTDIIRGAGGKTFENVKDIGEELGFIPEEKREQIINEFIDKYSKSDVENMLVIDRDGYGYYLTSNSPNEISGELFADKFEESYNIHTHPPEHTQFSFSTDVDIPAFFNDGSAVMEAVDYKYRYRFERPENITFDEWQDTMSEVENNISKILVEYGYDFKDYKEQKLHIIILETCKRLGIDNYKRWKI